MGTTLLPLLTVLSFSSLNTPPDETSRPVAAPVSIHHPRGYWPPGGYPGRIGSPYFYSVPGDSVRVAARRSHGRCGCGHHRRHHRGRYRGTGTFGFHHGGYTPHSGYVLRYHRPTDPYSYHFGPGYYRHTEHGHYRFPYYNYRSPWYYPGQPVYTRDTNFAW